MKKRIDAVAKAEKKAAKITLIEKIEMVALDKLKEWDHNPRINDPAVEPIAASIREYGMVVPILINKKNEVLAGNTRLKACRVLGLPKVPCVRAEHLTPQQQQAYNIADNKLGEIAGWDQDKLKEILDDIQKNTGAFDPSSIGFQQAEVDMMFQGWNSGAARVTDTEPEDTVVPGKVTIKCAADDEDRVRATVEKCLKKFEGIEIN